jgi:hypothetical protein
MKPLDNQLGLFQARFASLKETCVHNSLVTDDQYFQGSKFAG